MAEHTHTDRFRPEPQDVRGSRAVNALDRPARKEETDLVFAFSGGETLDLYGLSLLLTARQVARDDHKDVWVAGLSRRSWLLLRALGLEGLFKAFPPDGELRA